MGEKIKLVRIDYKTWRELNQLKLDNEYNNMGEVVKDMLKVYEKHEKRR